MPSQRTLVALLGFRTAGFLAVQAGIAVILALRGAEGSWTAAAAWWPLAAMITNLATVPLLMALMRREGARYRDLFRVDRATLPIDLAVLVLVLVLSGPLGALPGPAIASWLWGDPVEGARQMMQPLPPWGVAVAVVGFPLTVALAELPLYFGYVMPRLEAPRWAAWLACGLALAVQHVTLPFLPDAAFVLWRLAMFLPFALAIGLGLLRRPRILPWVCVVHGLIDVSAGWVVWQVSSGQPI